MDYHTDYNEYIMAKANVFLIQNSDDILGVVEATNNLLTSNILNLFVIQTIGILIYVIVN